jgi:hypothetical protein
MPFAPGKLVQERTPEYLDGYTTRSLSELPKPAKSGRGRPSARAVLTPYRHGPERARTTGPLRQGVAVVIVQVFAQLPDG